MEFYKEQLEKYIYSKIDNTTCYENNSISKLFIHKILKPKMIQLRKIEYSIIENDNLIENMISKQIVDENLLIINFLYHIIFLNYKEESLVYPFIHYYSYITELYDRNAFFYRCMNKYKILDFNNIRVVSVIEHNKCIEYVYKYYRESLPTIVTFDPHKDLEGILCKKTLKSYFNQCEHETFELNKRLYNSVPFIGSVLYPMVFPYETNSGIITITPEWSNFEFRDDYLYIDKDIENKNNGFISNFKINTSNNSIEKVEYKMCNISTFKSVDKSKITDNFILNIDLDYFCANGNPCDINSVKNNDIDFTSHTRTVFDNNHVKNTKYRDEVKLNLSTEIREIRKRINDFIAVCLDLKTNGKIPNMIILCDSTECNFTDSTNIHDYSTCTNNFTPKYLTLWIKTTVYNHLKNIYS